MTATPQSSHFSAINLLGWCALQHGYADADRSIVQRATQKALADLVASARTELWRKEALQRPKLTALIALAPLLKDEREDLVPSSDRLSLLRLLGEALSLYWEYEGGWNSPSAGEYMAYLEYCKLPRLGDSED